jgi:hypothetical protein
LPPTAETPDWSPKALDLLDGLTPLERGVVEWRATGVSAAEAYRRASGRPDAASARQAGHQVLARPRVAAALAACLADRNVEARCDREWMFQKLFATICEAQDMHSPAGMRVLVGALALLARLQGEIGSGRAVRPPAAQPAERPEVRKRIDEILADVARLTAGRKATPPEAVRLSDEQVARGEALVSHQRPRPAVEGRPAVAAAATPPATSSPTAISPPAATPAIPAATGTPPLGTVSPPPEDGLPIDVVQPFASVIRIPLAETVGPPQGDADQTGPVLPRVSSGPIRYRGASPYSMGTWQ